MKDILDIYISEVESARYATGRFNGLTVVFQLITKNEMRLSAKNGGNCMGFSESDGPLLGEHLSLPQTPHFLH